MFEFIKVTTPILMLMPLFYYYRKAAFFYQKLFIVWLFSFFSFAQNYAFFLRELHQVIQVSISIIAILYAFKEKSLTKVPAFFVIFGLFILMSLFFNKYDADAKAMCINFLSIVILFWSVINKKNVLMSMSKILEFWCYCSIIMSVMAIVEYFVAGIGRSEATLANPNYLAYILGVGFCATSILKTKGVLLIRLIIFSGILATASRSGILFAGFFLFSEAIYSKSILVKISTTIALIVGVVFIMSFLQENREGTEGSDGERILIKNVVIEIVKDKPVLGVGWGRFISEFSNYSSYAPRVLLSTGDEVSFDDREKLVTHNDYLRIVAELGVPALIMAIFATLLNFKLLIKLHPLTRQWLLPIWLGVVAFSLGHNNLNNATFWLFFWLPYLYTKLGYAR